MIRRNGPRLTSNSNIYANAMSQFAVCRQPWNAYIDHLAKQDATPFHTQLHDKPAYRGRKKGREGWVFNQAVQLHYKLFPDEHIFTNLNRWRQGDTIGDVALQQFRGAQPFDIENHDPSGFKSPSPETYMKLNYKNPATISRFLTKTGHLYAADILPLHPEAVKRIKTAKEQAIRIGVYPRFGNPFWNRSQKFRPKPYQENYDPVSYDTKKAVEHYAFNWVQLDRTTKYFQGLASLHQKHNVATQEERQQNDFYSLANDPIDLHKGEKSYSAAGLAEQSGKVTTVPGLMSTKGMKKKFHNLYSSTSKKRMGFLNPVYGIKKI